MADKKTCSP